MLCLLPAWRWANKTASWSLLCWVCIYHWGFQSTWEILWQLYARDNFMQGRERIGSLEASIYEELGWREPDHKFFQVLSNTIGLSHCFWLPQPSNWVSPVRSYPLTQTLGFAPAWFVLSKKIWCLFLSTLAQYMAPTRNSAIAFLMDKWAP